MADSNSIEVEGKVVTVLPGTMFKVQLSNGHVVQANWTGHNEKDYQPGWKLIEFDRNGKVVWTWHEPPERVTP